MAVRAESIVFSCLAAAFILVVSGADASFGQTNDVQGAEGTVTNAPSAETVVAVTNTTAAEIAYEAIAEMRRATEVSSKHYAELLESRLQQSEQAMADQRQREFQQMQQANRTLLVGIAALVTLGLIGMALMGMFMFRSVNRLAEVALTTSHRELLPSSSASRAALPQPTEHLLGNPGLENPAASQMRSVIDRLEQRIHELEQTATPPLTMGNGHSETTQKPVIQPAENSETSFATAPPSSEPRPLGPAERTALLLEKGETHLSLDQPDAAIKCFEEAIELQPDYAEAHLKRGTTLEKLEKFDEALASLDRALALDPKLATAYLCKGSVFNRLSRYDDALRCYEEALRAGKDAEAEDD